MACPYDDADVGRGLEPLKCTVSMLAVSMLTTKHQVYRISVDQCIQGSRRGTRHSRWLVRVAARAEDRCGNWL